MVHPNLEDFGSMFPGACSLFPNFSSFFPTLSQVCFPRFPRRKVGKCSRLTLALACAMEVEMYTLCTPHSTLCPPHLTLYTLHFTLRNPHFALYSNPLHSTIHSLHWLDPCNNLFHKSVLRECLRVRWLLLFE